MLSGFTNGMGLSIVQTLTNSGYNIEGVTYNVTPTANSCPGDAVPFTVTVFPVADVYSTPSSQAFCSGGSCNLTLASHVARTVLYLDGIGQFGVCDRLLPRKREPGTAGINEFRDTMLR